MRDTGGLQAKVQEMADCYKSTDYLKEMCTVPSAPDEGAHKWLALAVLHGINANAAEIRMQRTGSGEVTVTARYRETKLPAPPADVGVKVLQVIRGITHFEQDQEEGAMAFGWGNESLELRVGVRREGTQETVTLKFPE